MVQDGRERVLVGATVEMAALDLLGSSVVDGSDEIAAGDRLARRRPNARPKSDR
jgi:hypothetical protein